MVKSCAVCGHETREISDVSDALVDLALRNGADIKFVEIRTQSDDKSLLDTQRYAQLHKKLCGISVLNEIFGDVRDCL